jgi:uncharacterized protein (DUF1501 family)
MTMLSRRRFLEQLAAAGALTAGVPLLSSCSSGPSAARSLSVDRRSGSPVEPRGRTVPGAVDGRILVVVNLEGGNDGLSTLVPLDDPIYHDLRPSLALPSADVLALDSDVGLHPSLSLLHRRGIATVEGVGPVDGDLSHFAMTERWEQGDVHGAGGLRTGFLGRLADALDDGSPLVGVSTAGPTPNFTNQQAATMSLGSTEDFWFLAPTDWSDAIAYQQGLARFASAGDPLTAQIIESYGRLLDLTARLAPSEADIDWETPMIADGGDLGRQLHLAADLIEADVGVRIVYAEIGGFDTHSNHHWQQQDNLRRFDAAVGGFLERVDGLGLTDRVLVATTSEFGRRVEENDRGLDHGSASTMLLAGPLSDGRFGERPPLDDLDEDGNLRVTVGFDRYLATLAEEWLGIEAASVLPTDAVPLGIF